ncbi:hypothetical protein OP140_002994 [Salmonella enterica]|nr:hypothetical protein [Salmonella enterica]
MKKIISSLLLTFCFISIAYSGNDGKPGIGGMPGKGGMGGLDGIPGCDGGTNPSQDGKFYLPGTQQDCNPGVEDLKKLKSVDYSYKNIAECTQLLPQDGKQYTVNFNVIVDKNKTSTGLLTITDESKKELSDKQKSVLKSYTDCVKHLIK